MGVSDRKTEQAQQNKSAMSSVDWYAPGKTVSKTRRAGRWSPEHATFDEWLRAFAQKSGHTAHSLRRFAALVEFIERLSAEGRMTKEQAAAAHRAPMASLEVVKQVDRHVSPEAIDHLLLGILSGKRTYREVRAITKGMHRVIGRATVKEFPEWCARWIPEHASLFCPSGSEIEASIRSARVRGLRPVVPDFVLVTRRPGEPSSRSLVGFEFKFKSRFLTPSELDGLAGQLAFYSTFFTWFWLILPARTGADRELDQIFAQLGCANVGIADVEFPPPPKKADTRRSPFRVRRFPKGQPVPDRRGILFEQFEQLLPKERQATTETSPGSASLG